MTRERGRLRAAVVLLLLVSAALFAVGTSIERSHHSKSERPASESSPPAEGSSESGGDEHPSEAPSASNEANEKTSEKLFGFRSGGTMGRRHRRDSIGTAGYRRLVA